MVLQALTLASFRIPKKKPAKKPPLKKLVSNAIAVQNPENGLVTPP